VGKGFPVEKMKDVTKNLIFCPMAPGSFFLHITSAKFFTNFFVENTFKILAVTADKNVEKLSVHLAQQII
jgi:hypothetical protein